MAKTIRIEIPRHETIQDRIRCVQINTDAPGNPAYRLYTIPTSDERYTSLVTMVGADNAAWLQAQDQAAYDDFDPHPED